jgi:hypothetical protein
MVVSPEDREHLLAGCGPAVCETRDGGRSWTHHPVGDGKEFVEHLVFLRSGVALATTNPHAPRGETASPVVARSTDGGSTWVDVMAAGGILIGSGARPETAFLIRSGSNGDVLHRSDDGGATWRVISPPGVDEGPAGTPRFAVQSIVDSPRGGFVVATTFGLVHID